MKRKMAYFASSVLSVFALALVSVASVWAFHRPEVPQELLKK